MTVAQFPLNYALREVQGVCRVINDVFHYDHSSAGYRRLQILVNDFPLDDVTEDDVARARAAEDLSAVGRPRSVH